jgi:hypothetical protein
MEPHHFTVENVLYDPGLGTNLLSIAAVTDVGLSILFIETHVAFSNIPLYYIPKLFNNKTSRYSACLAVPSPSSMGIWHQRLAHTSYKNITKMAKNRAVDGLILPTNITTPNHPCIGFMTGKMHRLPFPVGRTRANQVDSLASSSMQTSAAQCM